MAKPNPQTLMSKPEDPEHKRVEVRLRDGVEGWETEAAPRGPKDRRAARCPTVLPGPEKAWERPRPVLARARGCPTKPTRQGPSSAGHEHQAKPN